MRRDACDYALRARSMKRLSRDNPAPFNSFALTTRGSNRLSFYRTPTTRTIPSTFFRGVPERFFSNFSRANCRQAVPTFTRVTADIGWRLRRRNTLARSARVASSYCIIRVIGKSSSFAISTRLSYPLNLRAAVIPGPLVLTPLFFLRFSMKRALSPTVATGITSSLLTRRWRRDATFFSA